VACNDWDHIQRLLIRAPLDAWELERLRSDFDWPGPGERLSAAVAACSLIAWAPLLRLRNSLKNFGCLNVWVISVMSFYTYYLSLTIQKIFDSLLDTRPAAPRDPLRTTATNHLF
jgi:hypothetical protein